MRWMDSRRNPTIILVGLQEYGCCSTEVCCNDYLVQPKGRISNAICYCSPMLCVQWVKVGDDCSFLVSYRRKPKGTIVLGSVLRPSVRPSILRTFFYVLWYIDLIFGMWLYLDELQFRFEFRSGRMIFGWVMVLELVFFVQTFSFPNFFLDVLWDIDLIFGI